MDWNEKINDKDFESLLVKNLADRPNVTSTYGAGGLSAKELKDWFDKSAYFLKDKINAIIEALGGVEALTNIRIKDESGKEVSAKEWIESKVEVNLNGKVIPIVNWVEIANKAISDRLLSSEVSVDAEPDKVVRRDAGGNILVGESDTAIGRSEVAFILANLVAQTLDGFTEEEAKSKAPSVQAVNEGLDSVKARGNDLKIELDYNEHLHKFRLHLVNADGEKQSSTEEIDLPLESTIIGIAVSEDGENLILTLNNGAQSTIPAEAIVRGLAKQEDLDELKEKFENQEVPKIELAPSLEGNEADKAPSVQAVNEGLTSLSNNVTGYVDKSVETSQNTLKKYVDESVSDIKLIVGQTHTVKRISATNTPIDVPDDALPVVMVSKISPFYCGTNVGKVGNSDFTVENFGDTTPSVSMAYNEFRIQAGAGETECEISFPLVDPIDIESKTDCVFASIELMRESTSVPDDMEISVYFRGDASSVTLDLDGSNRFNTPFAGNKFTMMKGSFRKTGLLNTATIEFYAESESELDIMVRVGIGKSLSSTTYVNYPGYLSIGGLGAGLNYPMSQILYDGKNIDRCGYIYLNKETAYYNYIDHEAKEAVVNLLRDGENVILLDEEVRIPIPEKDSVGRTYGEINIGEGTSRKIYLTTLPTNLGEYYQDYPVDCELMYVTQK